MPQGFGAYFLKMTYKELGEKALGLPEEPGVYLMKNEEGKVIYVGKAIVLRRRVYSYFSAPEKHTPKTAALVSHIRNFDVIVAKSELEALLLENNLIKKNKPKYNILLKDDKGYPFIRISGGEYPQLKLARKLGEEGEYFGPFYGSRSANSIIEAANRAFKLPTCNNPQPRKGRKPCLNHRIGRCMGPCGGCVTMEAYLAAVAGAREFLKGDIHQILESTQAQMEQAAELLEFERAAVLRDRLKAIRSILEKQTVASDKTLSGDYLTVLTGEELCAIYLLSVDGGMLVGKHCHAVKKEEIDNEASYMNDFLKAYYGAEPTRIPRRVVCGVLPEEREILAEYLSALADKRVQVIEPYRTEDKHLVAMALRNAKEELIIREGKTREHERAMFELSQLLGIADLESVEIYDISHQSGTDVVCGMAVYGRRGFLKDRYKKFRIAADANDDCGCMNEAAFRRFKRYKDGDESFAPLPSAVFADGALPQVRAVRQALNELGLYLPIFGLKKDSRHRTKSLIFEDGREVMLYKYPQIFSLCGRMQEEAHRFAITYHSAVARRRSLESMFTAVEGIGKARANAILKHFKTLSAIKAASVEELAQVKGMSKTTAEKLYLWLREQFP